MKTMKVLLMASLLIAGLGFSLAQSNDMQGMAIPAKINDLLFAGKTHEAVVEFENYKQEKQNDKEVNPYDVAFMEISFYRDLSMRGGWMFPMDDNMKQEYANKYEALKQQIIKKFPNRAEVYLMQCEYATAEDIVKYTTKAISLNPEIVDAYRMRATAYHELGKEDAAKADEDKVESLEKQSKEK